MNNDFRHNSQQVNAETPIPFGYDLDGLLVQAGDLTLTRDAANGLLAGTTISDAAATISDSVAYTLFGERSSYSADRDGTSLYTVTYSRDKLGRIVSKTQSIEGEPAVTEQYEYDLAGRLWHVKDGAGTILSEYNYGPNGNRLPGSFTQSRGSVLTASYDDQDRLLAYTTSTGGAATYTYTDNGELQTKTDAAGTKSYVYDVLGNLREVDLPDGRVIEYLLDAKNRRIGKKVDGVLSRQCAYKDQLNPVAELDGSGNLLAEYVYASKPNVPDYIVKHDDPAPGQSTTYRIVSDHLGSPRLVVDIASGTVTQRIAYDEFGIATLEAGTWDAQPFAFAGGLYDADTGLVRFGARDYDAETGRWTAKDPVRFGGGDTNLYGYVLDDPINLRDPNGDIPGLALGLLLGILFAPSEIGEQIPEWLLDPEKLQCPECVRHCNPSCQSCVG